MGDFYIDDAVRSGLELSQELPREAHSADLKQYLNRTGYNLRKRLDRIEIYTEYQDTLLKAIDNSEVPDHIVIEDSEDRLRDEIDRTSGRIGEEWSAIEPEFRELDQKIGELEEDRDRYSEDRIGETELLQRYGLETPEELHNLIAKYDILKNDTVQTAERIIGIDMKLPEELAGDLPSRDELAIGRITFN